MDLSPVARMAAVIDYHERSKHRLDRYAPSPGQLDWANQPDPFRRYAGVSRTLLPLAEPVTAVPTLDEALAGQVAPAPLTLAAVSRLLYDALAISAWKRAGSSRWAVRCNPSSGNLHPTEAYLLLPPLPGLGEEAGMYHYEVQDHALACRASLDAGSWSRLVHGLPDGGFLIALGSIPWREAWKYGERAYRYCQHDLGHALAQLACAAAALGWEASVLAGAGDDCIATLAGLFDHSGPEAEWPGALLALSPRPLPAGTGRRWLPALAALPETWAATMAGVPNRLSGEHASWPVIDEVALACRRESAPGQWTAASASVLPPELPPRPLPARQIFRSRRSAVEMDGERVLSGEAFVRLVAALLPQARAPWPALPWPVAVHPVFFLHRVRGFAPGVYLLLREPAARSGLQAALGRFPHWTELDEVALGLPLFRLAEGDLGRYAQIANCHQALAADGAFAVAMVAAFEPVLAAEGPAAYRRLFWEAGALGQVLYLEAEAAGMRGTGIGCYFDDVIHELLGITDRRFQSLYGFSVGAAVEDGRVGTEPAYPARSMA
ncbi:nitroreductase family protein [Azoarcus indigens]|uniref:SagB-type dehydrogenase family enzyme n=1 Tax=Azoarcus indigens TaxID=29545 RepID=A0A4R6DZU4_9RHOO|nr:nitroreductase family protein [Azoarcus indigens]TDN50917.1 SagB-type dehydrogenase family enzyme [Azoarcus indigens]